MTTPAVKLAMERAANLKCPQCDCTAKRENTFRSHCSKAHSASVSFAAPRTEEERRVAQREAEKRFRKKQQASGRMAEKARQRPSFTTADAEQRGHHQAKEGLLKYRPSRIPGAGNGLFACVALAPGVP